MTIKQLYRDQPQRLLSTHLCIEIIKEELKGYEYHTVGKKRYRRHYSELTATNLKSTFIKNGKLRSIQAWDKSMNPIFFVSAKELYRFIEGAKQSVLVIKN